MKKIILLFCITILCNAPWAQSDVIFADSFAYIDNCSSPTPSYCHPEQISTQGIHINEIMYYPHARGIVDENIPVFPWIEIYYNGENDLDLSSIAIKSEAQTLNTSLPFAMAPPNSFITVNMLPIGTITADFGLSNDLDFSDNKADIYIDFGGVINTVGDDIGLYQNNLIVAFSAYGDAFNSNSQLELDAITESLWISNDRISLDNKNPGETLSLILDGFYDHKQALGTINQADYGTIGWHQQSPSVHQQPSNAIQISPQDGSLIAAFPQTLTWQTCDDASGYLLELRNTENGGDLVVQRITQIPEYTIQSNDIDFDSLYWTVACLYNSLEKSSPFAQTWFLGTGVISDGGPTGNVLNVGHEFQRKDTNMLCLYSFDYNLPKKRGYGCEEEIIHNNGTCNWDSPHDVTSAAEVNLCGAYGANNCVRASIQMLHQYRSANTIAINQDYISYLVFNDKLPNGPASIFDPEGDLGAGVGMKLAPTMSVISSLFAINESDIEIEDDPNFNTIKNWIDEGRPIILWRWATSKQGHSTVIYGYQTTPHSTLFVHDPTLGNITVRYNEYMKKNQAVNKPAKAIVIPAMVGTMIGNPPNTLHPHPLAHVFNDSTDSDGVVNFDEIYRFYTKLDNADSDYDQVNDKQEIHSYTFPLGIGTFTTRNPDIDFDFVRAELDCDADNDSDHDGGEDINGNGGHNEPFAVGLFESDKYDSTDTRIDLDLDKAIYSLGEDVRLQGGSLSANTSYITETVSCPGLIPDSGIAGVSFDTNSVGFGDSIVAKCAAPGCYKVHLDVAKDSIWQQSSLFEIYTCDRVFEYTCTSCPPIDDGEDDELDIDGSTPAIAEPYFDIVTLTNNSLDSLDIVVEMHPGQAGPFPNQFSTEIILEIDNPQGPLPMNPPQTQGGTIWMQVFIPEVGPPIFDLQVWDAINGWQPQPELLDDFDIQIQLISVAIVELQLRAIKPIIIDTQEVNFSGVRLINHVPGQSYIDVMPEPQPLNPGLEFTSFVDLLTCE